MRQDRYPFFEYVLNLLSNQRRLLITIVTSNEVVNISISILAASLFIGLFGDAGQWISIVFTTVILLVVGEAIPKTFGVTYPMQISSVVSPLLRGISFLEYPFILALEKFPLFFSGITALKHRGTQKLLRRTNLKRWWMPAVRKELSTKRKKN